MCVREVMLNGSGAPIYYKYYEFHVWFHCHEALPHTASLQRNMKRSVSSLNDDPSYLHSFSK